MKTGVYKYNVIWVDDEVDQLFESSKRLLKNYGINILASAHTAQEFHDEIKYKLDLVDAVITDANFGDKEADLMKNENTLRGLRELERNIEANHDVHMLQVGPYPYPLKQRILGDRGHLSNERSGQLLSRLLHDKMQTIVLGHLSQENNLPQLAYETVKLEINMDDTPYKADDFNITVARRSAPSKLVVVR